MKSVHWHPLARRDVDEAAEWYAGQGGLAVELAFVDALESAIAQLARHSGTGSVRYAELLKIPALRFWPLGKFPYLIFYVEREHQVDIWRVLHAQRDVPAWMGPSE